MDTGLVLIFGSMFGAYMIMVVYVAVMAFKRSSFDSVIQGSRNPITLMLNSLFGFIFFLIVIVLGAFYIPILTVQSLFRR